MQTINIREAKTQFSRIVDQVAAGEEITIARAGKLVARLVPLTTPRGKARKLGLGKKRFTFPAGFDKRSAQIQRQFEQGE